MAVKTSKNKLNYKKKNLHFRYAWRSVSGLDYYGVIENCPNLDFNQAVDLLLK